MFVVVTEPLGRPARHIRQPRKTQWDAVLCRLDLSPAASPPSPTASQQLPVPVQEGAAGAAGAALKPLKSLEAWRLKQ